ncbi:MAG: sialate O-acetylesterase [Bacteroidales bacterium]|nr:sialate O-acetylesterase [Bacteroidales bacterium]
MKRLIIIAFLSCLCMAAEAKLVLGGLFCDGVVLQQNTKAAVWGTADPGSQISVSPSWNGTSYRCKADLNGCWKVFMDTPAGSYESYSFTVRGNGEAVKVNDVLVGEVWMASGQSNMEMPMRGFFNCPVKNAIDFISAPSAEDKIRMFNVPKSQSYEPLRDVKGEWNGACSSTVPEMSATAYFFARELNEVLDVPVGIISAAYGGARVESWLPEDILETYPDENLSRDAIEAMQDYIRPYLAYNAMFTPVKGFTVKGFIWYQGCSNVGRHEQFPERMAALIRHWREQWGDTKDELPFYMVEIAPYRYKPAGPVSNAALLRQAQHDVAADVPNCGIVVTNDLVESYEMDNIHPARKREVGQRLAYLALNRDYGHSRIACESPVALECIAMKDSNEVGVVLSHCDNGLGRWMEIEGLEVAGSEGVFYPVTYAYFEWESRVLRVRSEFVHDPCEVRYGWGDFKPGNLKNAEGLPVAPFRIRLNK